MWHMELAYLKKVMKEYHGNINWAADSNKIKPFVIYGNALRSFSRDRLAQRVSLSLILRKPKQNSMACPEARKNFPKR